ncbi:unnamed protein product [Lymnaea stagnalis]|uniref:SOCS box domain-containing protein n=1 Tax=Lymnaea stagnalis TaxID=6523 RepID=A0AAV2IJM8_LYMST
MMDTAQDGNIPLNEVLNDSEKDSSDKEPFSSLTYKKFNDCICSKIQVHDSDFYTQNFDADHTSISHCSDASASFRDQQKGTQGKYYAMSNLRDAISGEREIKEVKGVPLFTDRTTPMLQAISFIKFDWPSSHAMEHTTNVHVHEVGFTNLQVKLMDAIHNDDTEIVKDLLMVRRLNPNFNLQMVSPICRAAAKGNVEIMNLLLDAGADPNTPNSDDLLWERRPIHIAASKGHLCVLKLLVQRGASINQPDSDHRTPLHWVAMYGQSHMIKWMIEAGASVNATQTDGFTPLHTASCLGHTEVCRALVEGGADIISHLDHDGWTPLHTAVCYGYIEIVELFMENGANPREVTLSQLDSPLHIACSKGNVEIIDLLLKKGVPIEGVNYYGATPLYTAVCYNQGYSAYYLIKAGANVNAKNSEGKTSVYSAALHSEMETLQALIQAGGRITKDVQLPLGHNLEFDTGPQSLTTLCFLLVRQMLAPNLQRNAKLLPIPEVLKRALVMNDLKLRTSHRHCDSEVISSDDAAQSNDLHTLIWVSNIT